MPASIVYSLAGTELAKIETTADIFNIRLLGSLVLLSIMPLAGRWAAKRLRRGAGRHHRFRGALNPHERLAALCAHARIEPVEADGSAFSACRSARSCSAAPASSTAGPSRGCSNSPPSPPCCASWTRAAARVKPINMSVSFMRGGTEQDTFAAATVTRIGGRVANVEAHAWQQDRARPIAAAQLNLLVKRA
jgi:hypothetical protein